MSAGLNGQGDLFLVMFKKDVENTQFRHSEDRLNGVHHTQTKNKAVQVLKVEKGKDKSLS